MQALDEAQRRRDPFAAADVVDKKNMTIRVIQTATGISTDDAGGGFV